MIYYFIVYIIFILSFIKNLDTCLLSTILHNRRFFRAILVIFNFVQ